MRKKLFTGIFKLIDNNPKLILFIPRTDCYNQGEDTLIETFNAITRSNWPENFVMKCHEAIYSDFCLKNGTNSVQVYCSEEMGKLSTEETTTTTRDTVASKVILGQSETTYLDEDSQPSPTTVSESQDSPSVVTENVDFVMSTFIVTTIKEELDLTFNFSSESRTVSPSVPLIINQTAAARESTQIPAGNDSIQNNTDQIPFNDNKGLTSSGTSGPVNSNIEYVPKSNGPTFSEAEIFLIFGATISLCLFLLCCLCILCLRKW